MDRRKFFKIGSLATIGSSLVYPLTSSAAISNLGKAPIYTGKTPKNIIMLVSDGMSQGTLSMTDLFLQRKFGQHSNWIKLYHENKVSRAVMDMSSANSVVTDSAAASSSWGGGFRVNNGALNISPSGEENMPIWQKFKKAGKKAGCVTTVAITHATPAGFCVNSKKRNAQDEIAENYLKIGFDVLMGGGNNFFDAEIRNDKQDLYKIAKNKGYQIIRKKSNLDSVNLEKPLLGIFADDSLPYAIDRENFSEIHKEVPSLADMTQKAIEVLNHKNEKGFVLQIESGKVDWAAHANDIGGLLHEQIALDLAIQIAIDFAEKDKNTLVIITTDHGNSNPGIIFGKKANDNFDSLQKYKMTNESILNSFDNTTSIKKVIETIEYANGTSVSLEDAKKILNYYSDLEKSEGGLYNYRNLPFKLLSEIQQKTNSVGWTSMDHTSDYVELAMFGPGSEKLKPFIKNTDLHHFMLEVAEVEYK